MGRRLGLPSPESPGATPPSHEPLRVMVASEARLADGAAQPLVRSDGDGGAVGAIPRVAIIL